MIQKRGDSRTELWHLNLKDRGGGEATKEDWKGETRQVGKRPRKCDTVKANCQQISRMGTEECQLDLTAWKTLGTWQQLFWWNSRGRGHRAMMPLSSLPLRLTMVRIFSFCVRPSPPNLTSSLSAFYPLEILSKVLSKIRYTIVASQLIFLIATLKLPLLYYEFTMCQIDLHASPVTLTV